MSTEFLHRPGAHRGWEATSYDSIDDVNQSVLSELMVLRSFKGQRRSALAGFKSRWSKQKWMRKQRGYLERACLVSASGESIGVSFCQCGLNYRNSAGRSVLQTCKKVMFCPGCKYHRLVVPAQAEYGPAFEKAKHWYALTGGWQNDPAKAGLHWVTKQGKNGKAEDWDDYLPWANLAGAPFMPRIPIGNVEGMLLLAELPFKFAERLKDRGFFDGLFVVFEWHFEFFPTKQGDCRHAALPHVHMFGNRATPLTFAEAIEIQKLYIRTCIQELKLPELPAYPDVEIAPITCRERLMGWLNYQIKTMPIEKFYKDALRAGCSLTALNREFNETIWSAINLVRSPRKFGNLYASTPTYIGVQQFKKLTKTQFERLTTMQESGTPLSAKDQKLLEHHFIAIEQQNQRQAENRERRALAKLKEEDALLNPKRAEKSLNAASGAERA